MAQIHDGTFRVPGGFTIQNSVPADDRTVTDTLTDLYTTLPNIYPGITVAVAAEGYALYRWNGNDRTQAENWPAVSGSSSGGAGTLYFARAEYTSTQVLGGVEFLDPSGAGDFKTVGATVGPIVGNSVDLSFTNESTPPKEIIAFGYQANLSRYVITQLDGGGNNSGFYALGATESSHTSSFSIGNQVTTDIFTNFGTAKLTLDLSMANLDAVREAGGFGNPTKETHAFIVFRF